MTKYIVVHSGARDQYKLAEALFKHGKLGYLVTDDILFRREYKGMFPRSLIKISYLGLLVRMILKVYNFGERMQQQKGKYLGRTAGKLSKRKNMPLMALQEYAYHAYQYSDVRPRIVFQFHPQANANKMIFVNEIRRNPEMSGFTNEMSIYTPKKIQEAEDELRGTDYYIAASSFTKQTLVENGADPLKIFVAPYGVDTSKYPFKDRVVPKTVQFVFVGSFVERKGAFYLLQAVKRLEEEGLNFRLKIISRFVGNESLLKQLGIRSVEVLYNVSHSELISNLHNSDVFVFPSLFEGFAFVIVEAMSSGLPVITTPRTCGFDVITEGEEGFIIEPSDVEALYEKMKFFILHPERCPVMGKKAARRAKLITWQNFENKIIEAVETIEKQS
ncbi:MAG: glycosyltransferase family 4 protein [Prevotella sp.]|nr:glycosyltransferase family 4 protein [Prevotella sp.]